VIKAKLNSIKALQWIPILMGILLITAPCSVRNSLEQSIGIEKSKTLNKSKSVQQADCEIETKIQALTEKALLNYSQIQNSGAEKAKELEVVVFSNSHPLNSHNKPTFLESSVPLYILLKRLKYML
jgi:hypothetical protein